MTSSPKTSTRSESSLNFSGADGDVLTSAEYCAAVVPLPGEEFLPRTEASTILFPWVTLLSLPDTAVCKWLIGLRIGTFIRFLDGIEFCSCSHLRQESSSLSATHSFLSPLQYSLSHCGSLNSHTQKSSGNFFRRENSENSVPQPHHIWYRALDLL